jgi:hypothetical protein
MSNTPISGAILRSWRQLSFINWKKSIAVLQNYWNGPYVILGKEPAAVAQSLGITIGTVYAAKSKVIGRLRQDLHGLVD